jgi:hypothetical protein
VVNMEEEGLLAIAEAINNLARAIDRLGPVIK